LGNVMILLGQECSKLASSIAIEKGGDSNIIISTHQNDNFKVDHDIYRNTDNDEIVVDDEDDVGEIIEI